MCVTATNSTAGRGQPALCSALQVKTGQAGASKDLEMSPFEAAKRLLSFDAEGLSLK